MKYGLHNFQEDATNELLKKMQSMRKSYEDDGSLSSIALTAPTGAGKTVISAAVIEGLFYGNSVFPGDSQATVLWLSDSPSLNAQTMKRFEAASDLLIRATTMTAIGPEFAMSHDKFERNHIYFLNRQLLSAKGRLVGEAEGSRSFYDVLTNSIEDPDMHLYLFIDEAHKGLGKETTSDSLNKTIYAKLIDGQSGKNPPMPIVIGITATPERFENAMKGRGARDKKAPVNVSIAEVRQSGLIKDVIELRTPKEVKGAADTIHQDLTLACKRLAEVSSLWKEYCHTEGIPSVVPLLVVQVEDKVSSVTLDEMCNQISKHLPWIDASDGFGNVFGEHEDIVTGHFKIPYCLPEEVSSRTEIRVLFAKDAVSTGWDCPRAEVIYSRRKRNDPTYIAQLIGRMIRSPLGRRIISHDELNTVSCFLPEYDAQTVEMVVEKLKEESIDETTNIIKNPASVTFFNTGKQILTKKLQKIQNLNVGNEPDDEDGSQSFQSGNHGDNDIIYDFFDDNVSDFPDVLHDSEARYTVTKRIQDTLSRLPQVDGTLIKESFEEIVTRQVRHDKEEHFLDLWDCIDIINDSGLSNGDIGSELFSELYFCIEGEIVKHQAVFNRSYKEINQTEMTISKVDPLTGEKISASSDFVISDEARLARQYKNACSVFAGSADFVNYYINKRKDESFESDRDAIARIGAVARCLEVVQALEEWADKKISNFIDAYGPHEYAISESYIERWREITGNARPYIEKKLVIPTGKMNQNKNLDAYEKHITSDSEGWAYFQLNDLEKKIVKTELGHIHTVAWYRNQPKNLNYSLSIPYSMNGQMANMYPDFIFFQNVKGKIIRTIVDPHGDWLGDSIAKLQGYVDYLRDFPAMFGSVLAVADEANGECRYLELTDAKVQAAIKSFTGNTAKALFIGPYSKEYKC